MIFKALKQANMSDFVQGLSEGINTNVGASGS